ncbi:hypothetical protein TrCOL_g13597 [Triparma columacea]|uniref:Rieske domain-containing protein n=1 Tax=Triparma columacea TaxID=722753 RepID=A0A9W7GJJ0_9STRA|nr:hypothetical protein TrCOL_g13597 [Triparma columacea]
MLHHLLYKANLLLLLSFSACALIAQVPRTNTPNYSNFDWLDHWYPVTWMRDLPVNTITKVTLFDVDYCVVNRGEQDPLALEDKCPHRLAALSEGRLTAQGYVQCAYHGWSFDATGACKSVPQRPNGAQQSTMLCATACPCRVEQGLLWLFPGANAENAKPPPRVQEMDDPAFKWSTAVRDLPIDYSILIENILDPDHGLFAHQAAPFDLYTASRDAPQTVTLAETSPGFFSLSSAVSATPKLAATKEKTVKDTTLVGSALNITGALTGISTFRPPCTIATGRRDADGETKFQACFWIAPVGIGRTRFMSAAVGRLPFSVPRWLQHVSLNNFLDQDTHLLATQQPNVLAAEYKAATGGEPMVRRKIYKYSSPTERLLVEVGKFMDAAVPKTPNRYAEPLRLLMQCPDRSTTLDRYSQHTQICPDSRGAVRNAKALRFVAWAAAATVAAGRVARLGSVARAVSPAALGLAALGYAAHAFVGEFSFKYVSAKRDRDLRGIPKVFADERLDE